MSGPKNQEEDVPIETPTTPKNVENETLVAPQEEKIEQEEAVVVEEEKVEEAAKEEEKVEQPKEAEQELPPSDHIQS